MDDLKQLNARVTPEVHVALDILHRRFRINKTAAVQLALLDFLAKYGIAVEKPAIDVIDDDTYGTI